ncbi:MAG: DoxX family membrane protein [Ignavibacteria bacterium]|nr:DoxX family membrane protein [Ignavibacteria bacterium]
MKDFLYNKYFQIIIRLIIGAVFIYASVGKLFHPAEFAKAILRYELLPLGLVNIQAIIMPWVEFTLGILLITGIFKKGTLILASISLVMFLFALISAYARGLDISCGCFSLEETSSKGDILSRIIQDFFMLIGTVIIFLFSKKPKINETITDTEQV